MDYATLDDIQSRRGGDDPIVSDKWDGVIVKKIGEISRDLDRMVMLRRGSVGPFQIVSESTSSSRTFAVPEGGARMLSIDDCTALTSVTLTPSTGAPAQVLVDGTDYRLVRSRGVIVGLRGLQVAWPSGGQVAALARWGLMDAISPDLREVVAIETIRSFMGDRANGDDTLGMTPFGQISTAKAFTSKVGKFVADNAYGGASLRGN